MDLCHFTALETLYNEKLRRSRCIVENASCIMKQTFCELLLKRELIVTFLSNIILCCVILHNILMDQSHKEVGQFLEVLQVEGLHGEVVDI